MRVCGLTDIGCRRQDNQDSWTIRHLEGGAVLLVVCDGMGGAQAGSVASSVAVEAFAAAVEAAGLPEGRSRRGELLASACRGANEEVYRLSRTRPEYEGMGTTLVAALALAGEVCFLNVGDSRGYVLTDRTIRQATVDHSLVQMLVDRGEITPTQARVHPQKNLITRALGVEGHVECDLTWLEPEAGSRLLLCSDGLSNVVNEQEMLYEVIHGGEDAQCCHRLLDIALSRGAPDNVTAVLVKR